MTVSKLFIDSDRGVDTAEGWRQIIHRIYKGHVIARISRYDECVLFLLLTGDNSYTQKTRK